MDDALKDLFIEKGSLIYFLPSFPRPKKAMMKEDVDLTSSEKNPIYWSVSHASHYKCVVHTKLMKEKSCF